MADTGIQRSSRAGACTPSVGMSGLVLRLSSRSAPKPGLKQRAQLFLLSSSSCKGLRATKSLCCFLATLLLQRDARRDLLLNFIAYQILQIFRLQLRGLGGGFLGGRELLCWCLFGFSKKKPKNLSKPQQHVTPTTDQSPLLC